MLCYSSLMCRYSKLWNRFRDKEFRHEEAFKELNEKDENLVSCSLSTQKT
ncbi:MAG: hypothetical protein QMD36_06175 [Candidatus Aenigmarchaeota archaeon]|nr:hypothetical protein [Candidatus Aenigmarchaeota archaeon]